MLHPTEISTEPLPPRPRPKHLHSFVPANQFQKDRNPLAVPGRLQRCRLSSCQQCERAVKKMSPVRVTPQRHRTPPSGSIESNWNVSLREQSLHVSSQGAVLSVMVLLRRVREGMISGEWMEGAE